MDAVPASLAITQVLAGLGVTHVYGIPGGYSIKLFEAAEQTEGITPVLVPLEQTAACMADIHGRLTGVPAVVSGQGAFIGGTASFGIMEAYLSGTPMIIVTEMTDHGLPQHAPTQSMTGDYGSVDLPAMLKAMCKFVTVARTPNEAAHGAALAYHHATSGRPGPAALVCALDAMYADVKPTGDRLAIDQPVRVGVRSLPQAEAASVRAVAARLSTAARPVIVAGNGTHRHYAALDALARRAATPVVTTTKARGVIADTHEWSVGPLSVFGAPGAYQALREADTVLVLGSRLNPGDTLMESPSVFDHCRQHIVQIDCVAENLGRAIPVHDGIVADIGAFLSELVPQVGVEESLVDRRWAWVEMLRGGDEPQQLFESSSPLSPYRVVQVLNEAVSDDHRVVLDAGNNRIFNYRYLRMPQPGRLHICGGHLGMGWGPSAALAAAQLRPHERVWSVVGDGGMQMSFHTLAFAAAHRLNITFVVMNNGVLGNVVDAQRGVRAAVDLVPVDYAAVAQAFGVSAARVDTDRDLAAALAKADANAGPTLIEVAVSPAHSSSALRNRV